MTGTGISGHITTPTDWSGDVTISGLTTIDAGVTVTIAAGTTITVKGQGGLQIAGILDAQGTSAARVIIKPETPRLGRHQRQRGRRAEVLVRRSDGRQHQTNGTGKATIRDTHLSKAAGDFVIMNGGTIDMRTRRSASSPAKRTRRTARCTSTRVATSSR